MTGSFELNGLFFVYYIPLGSLPSPKKNPKNHSFSRKLAHLVKYNTCNQINSLHRSDCAGYQKETSILPTILMCSLFRTGYLQEMISYKETATSGSGCFFSNIVSSYPIGIMFSKQRILLAKSTRGRWCETTCTTFS